MAVASTRHWDPKYYSQPEKFDAYRFLNMRNEPGKENVAQFVSTSASHLGFGHGKHACPGRFFASNEIKIIMCHILLKYDWRLVNGQEPKFTIQGWNLIADHSTKLEIRRRAEEIDLDTARWELSIIEEIHVLYKYHISERSAAHEMERMRFLYLKRFDQYLDIFFNVSKYVIQWLQ